MIMKLRCAHRNYHSLVLLALGPLVADLTRADIAASAATVAAATEDDDRDDGTEPDDRPGRITLITIHPHHERIS